MSSCAQGYISSSTLMAMLGDLLDTQTSTECTQSFAIFEHFQKELVCAHAHAPLPPAFIMELVRMLWPVSFCDVWCGF